MDEIKLQSIHDKHWDVVRHQALKAVHRPQRRVGLTCRQWEMRLRYEVSCLA